MSMMSEEVAELKASEDRSTASPIRLKADRELVADVSVNLPTARTLDDTCTSFHGSSMSLSEMLPDVPSDDESGEVFDKMVASMLIGMNMQQYVHLFKEADVGLNMFLYLTEDDLEVIGVTDKKDRTDIAHGIANIRRRKKDDEQGPKSISGDIADVVLSAEQVVPIVCHTVKHINNLVLLLRNYRSRLESKQMRNSMIDNQHCAALGVKILTKEALVQADLLKVQLNGLLAKLEPALSETSPYKKNRQLKSKTSRHFTDKIMYTVLVMCSLTLVSTLAFGFRKR